MLDTITSLPGDHLDLSSYDDDFGPRFRSLRNADIQKLERQQVFHQPENESWLAFQRGHREESLRQLEADRPGLRELFSRLARIGCRVQRVRVVDEPISTYLLWELHSLRIRAQCGEDIRVISSEPLSAFERDRPVPEIVTLGEEVTYRILYAPRGEAEGAVRYLDPGLTARCAAQIASLHRRAEPLEPYFVREVAPKDVSGAR
ncbi:DUF6879 family protein [Nocardiopsis sp. JB363]|uniref:DUF6879 family protein n=1 Tax=Nocardiopsis sp. JB363 TaxID=1434837 RepID=UPI00097B5DAE|nr:DUF6879 family protein [Nocardiopsis sp. JB363]SIO85556.1 hypothetical protein BQ8420_07550 [Nocardiopsis sp. JB363]